MNIDKKNINFFAIIGFIFMFIIPMIGFVFSIIGLKKSKELGNGELINIFSIIIFIFILAGKLTNWI